MTARKHPAGPSALTVLSIALSTVTIALVTTLLVGACSTGEPGIVRSQSAVPVAVSTDGLRSLQSSFRSIAETALPSVVRIDVRSRVAAPRGVPFGRPDEEEPGRREYESEGLGSGVIVSRDGRTYYVLTNDHVVADADDITVVLDDGTEYDALLVGRDRRKDLAMVSFRSTQSIPVARLGDSDSLRVGDWVAAIGSPFGYQNTLTVGVVSAVGRSGAMVGNISDFIQTDAAINRGNSGGALVNLDGEVVGINTWITSATGVSAGLGFAIPINNTIRSVETMLRGGEIEYGWLGVSIQSVDRWQADSLQLPSRRGALIDSVFIDSPAQGDILPGDFIVAIDGSRVNDSDHLILIVGELRVGAEPTFRLYRQGLELEVQVRIGARSSEASIRQQSRGLWPGMSVYPLTPELADRLTLTEDSGVVVLRVDQGTPAYIAGVVPYDIVHSVNGAVIESMLDFYATIAGTDSAWEMVVVRDGQEQQLTVVR